MAVLADLERLLERVFERSTARLFRAHPQAVQLERRVERSMERARASRGGRITVPVRYRVRLEPGDLRTVADASGGPDVLAGRLADAALAFARAHSYHLPERPRVSLVADPSVQQGVIEVDAAPSAGEQASMPAGAELQGSGVPDMPVVAPRPAVPPVAETPGEAETGRSGDLSGRPDPRHEPEETPASEGAPAPDSERPVDAGLDPDPSLGGDPIADQGPGAPAAAPTTGRVTGGVRGDGSSTLVFRRPVPVPTRALLRLSTREGREQAVEVDGTPLAIGRASDNGLVIRDPRVSRHHARLQARRGTLVLTDLGSTNGTRVNGVRVDECALGAGDRVLIGDTVLLVEQLPD